jgi:hypothetical protein
MLMLVHPGPFISPVVGPKLTANFQYIYNKSVPFNMSLNHPYSVKWLIKSNIRVWGAESFLFSQESFFFQIFFFLLCPVLFRSHSWKFLWGKGFQIVNWICKWVRTSVFFWQILFFSQSKKLGDFSVFFGVNSIKFANILENFTNCPFRLLIWTIWGGVSFVKWTRPSPSNSVLAYYHYY